jgi:uncharacterized protein (TIGR02231 family)
MSETLAADAPIVAVTVYPYQARVTRRGRVELAPGSHTVSIDGLPSTLVDDSVRVGGRGASARVTGVDVARRHHPAAPDPTIKGLESRLRDLELQDRQAGDEDAALVTETEFVEATARRGGREMARALAAGEADEARVAAFGSTLRGRLGEIGAARRDLGVRREALARDIAAIEAELADRRRQAATDRRAVEIGVDADADTAVEIELSYVVPGAGWRPVYDARLDGSEVVFEWSGLITQETGEDWPAGELILSTARPAVSTTIPELDPWFVDIVKFHPVARPRMAARAPVEPMVMAEMAEMAVADAALAGPVEASAEQGATAVSYRLPRPVAVPSDGSPHKAHITRVELGASLDYIAAPKLAEEAYLRAKVTNQSPHTLLAGSVSVFHGDEFVGTTSIEPVAPGGEIELHLGVDDRVKVERELVKRDTDKTVLQRHRRTAVAYKITIENHLPDRARITVLDQFPVSRHEDVKVRDTEAKPEPKERTDLDVVTWELDVDAGAKRELLLSFTLEHPKNERLAGWTD